ncbi:hypothetical protein HC891_19215 [Candidatus Gracilibacteria bacterium]|nr:hypothetical protein [Candidatus Gracilibacteria bacterium]
MKQHIVIDCTELRHLYCDESCTMRELAERYRCSTATISVRLRNCGIEARSGRFEARDIPEAQLRRLYLVERQPLVQIAAHFGVSVATLYNRRRAYGMPTRTEQDSIEQGAGVAD